MTCGSRNSANVFRVIGRKRHLLAISFFLLSCHRSTPLFTLVEPGNSGIYFQNKLPVDDTTFNILDYIYYFNGGGVATGDINNDGLIDIFFTSNLGENKLYLNKGNFKFEDITAKAGVAGKSNWKTGVTMADVNGDGFLDIYVCAVGNYKKLHGRNELYINNGDGTFTASAKEYGLDIEAFSTQATFFDYDKDGDLDMFLVCHSVHSTESLGTSKGRATNSLQCGDKLFINEQKDGRTHFREVTQSAGIYSSALGYGLNAIVGDFNNDNWDDIYVSNDFHENDYYYLNNRDGTFTETNEAAFGHESRFSMGSDAADFNNDGWLDIITMDMLPKDEKVLKCSAGDDPFDIFNFKRSYGYHTQYSRNCLQLNVAGGKHFSDIGLYAGVEATDWSWCPLVADFDNDGIKDLFVTNGIVKRPNDLDYIKFANSPSVFHLLENGKTADQSTIDRMPSGKTPNYIFAGSPEMKFEDRSGDWGFGVPTLSNGAAYADLDNDGDLDLIVNNINDPAGVYRNNARETGKNNYLDVLLQGNKNNTAGIGAKVVLKADNKLQLNYVAGSRGFLSASTEVVHFGLGSQTNIDTLEVLWPSGKIQRLMGVKANQRLKLRETDAVVGTGDLLPTDNGSTRSALFEDITSRLKIGWKHRENTFSDFNVQALIPHMVSTQGPKLAVADINKDGLDDFFVCGARGQQGALYQQQKDGTFRSIQESLFAEDSASEDVNALFFDANGDGFPDLYVVSGGNEFAFKEKQLQDRLYLNDGKGEFRKYSGLPEIYGNKSVAVAADFDRDGDLDLFIGGRVVANSYGVSPTSYLLLNDGKGNFSIAPDSVAAGLSHIGMVTDAVWTDKDQDGWQDLVIVGEWMPITYFRNNRGKLENKTVEAGLSKTAGLWQSIKAEDIDKDGFPDLLAGNWGANSKLTASEDYPLELFVGDIDGNGVTDQILGVSKGGQCYPFLNKENIEKQLPVIRKKFANYASMAGLTVDQIFGEHLQYMKKLTANTLYTSMLINTGDHYRVEKMPAPVQWFPVFAWAVSDFNGDGWKDILAAGNFFGVSPFEGRYDAGFGQVLLQTKKGWLTPLPIESGLIVNGEVRDIQKLRTGSNQYIYLIARNNDSLVAIAQKEQKIK
jgi:hypothetical protein